jgi:hypothetical protein
MLAGGVVARRIRDEAIDRIGFLQEVGKGCTLEAIEKFFVQYRLRGPLLSVSGGIDARSHFTRSI